MKKFKGTFIFGLLTIALALYVYFVEIKKVAKDEEKKTQEEKIFNFETSQVKGLSLKNKNGEFELEKKDNGPWTLTKPLSDLADESSVNGILSDLNTEKYDQIIEGEELKTFGLDNPASNLTLTFKDGSHKKVFVGADAAIPGKVYLLREGEKSILYANSGVKTQIDKTIKDLRDKKIFRDNKDDIVSLHIGEAVLTKKVNNGQTQWTLEKPDESADSEVVSGYLNSLENLRATDFPSEKSTDKADLKKYGLVHPVLDLKIEGKDNKSLAHITLGEKKENNTGYAIVEGRSTIYQLFWSGSEGLLKKRQDFKDKKKPFEFKKDDVSEIFTKSSLSEVHITKKGSNWELPLPDSTKEVSQIQVSSLIDKLSNLRVAEYPEGEKPKGLRAPVGQVILKDPKGAVLLDFAWGERSKNKRNYFAKTQNYSGSMTVDSSTVDGFPMQTLVEAKATPTPAPAPSGAPKSAVPQASSKGP